MRTRRRLMRRAVGAVLVIILSTACEETVAQIGRAHV